jgi:hypothetical protein
MALWEEFCRGALPYQGYWLPVFIGMAAGMLCVFAGNIVWRGKKRSAAKPALATPVNATHDPFVHGSQTEQRKSVRRAGHPIVLLYARAENRKVVQRALVLDRSLGGLRLATDEEVAPGTRLFVLSANATESVPWIEVDVCRNQQVDDSWELNCQFVKTPPWSILLLFG